MQQKRPRLQVDCEPEFIYAVNAIAANESIKRKSRVTQNSLVMEALIEKWPQLREVVNG